MKTFAVAAFALLVLLALGYWLWSQSSVIRARRTNRRIVADKVLALASRLKGHRLWVALPYPQLEPDPEKNPESWDERPRQWVEVVSRADSMLVLEGGDRIDALGCEWYVYADGDGKALECSVVSIDGSGKPVVPPGVDPESIAPSDVRFGDSI